MKKVIKGFNQFVNENRDDHQEPMPSNTAEFQTRFEGAGDAAYYLYPFDGSEGIEIPADPEMQDEGIAPSNEMIFAVAVENGVHFVWFVDEDENGELDVLYNATTGERVDDLPAFVMGGEDSY